MVSMISSLMLAAPLLASALPGMVKRQSSGGALPDNFNDGSHDWIPQQPGQVRSPCPALNTLANHNYLPRSGKGITRTQLSNAFEQGFGVDESVIETPTENAFSVCEFLNGHGNCPDTFDLNDLNTPDTFEHDHSMSRQDYKMLWAGNLPVDNHSFNRTIFGTGLREFYNSSVVGVDFVDGFRLDRESTAYQLDPADDFKLNRLTELTEFGFVFAVMRNFDGARNGVSQQSANLVTDQSVHVDWWMYWFSRQQFPVELGWRKPVEFVKNKYVTEIRSSIFSANPPSTPSPLPPGEDEPLTEVPLFASKLKREEILPSITELGIALPSLGISSILALPTEIVSQVIDSLGPKPDPLHPYDVKYSAGDFSSYRSALSSYKTAFDSSVESILGLEKRAEATPAPTAPAAFP